MTTTQHFKRKPTVLIIEDEKLLCELMVKKLKKSGFSVSGAFDGETGLEMIEKEKPDIILLDILLPGIDGFEVLRRIKTNDRFKDLTVIIVSNLGESADIERALQGGAATYLIKAESSPAQIVSKVQEYLKV